MTVKELITKLLDRPMNEEVLLCYNKEHIDELGEKCSGYCFHIDDVQESDIMFTDWRDKAESEPQESEDDNAEQTYSGRGVKIYKEEIEDNY